MKHILTFIGSGFGFGLVPLMPGTVGTVSGLTVLFLATLWFGWIGFIIFLVASIFFSAISLPSMTNIYGKDPSPFVLDEWIGMALPFGLLIFEGKEMDPLWIVIAFVLFRIFDISKVWGINGLQRLHGWFGVVLDDVLAGIYSLLIIKILIFIGYTIF